MAARALVFWVYLSASAGSEASEQRHRACIIGAGIGGASTAHFLRELEPDVELIVIEQSSRAGGRLDTTAFGPSRRIVETGGAIVHSRNQYIRHFTDILGLNRTLPSYDNGPLGIFGDKSSGFVYRGTGWKALDALRMLWRYGYPFVRMRSFVSRLLDDFDNIYKLQNDARAFRKVEDLLSSAHPSLLALTQRRLDEVLGAYDGDDAYTVGAGPNLINEFVAAVQRINYGQNSTLNALAGAVCLAASQGELFAIQGGNWRVAHGLLERAVGHGKSASEGQREAKGHLLFSTAVRRVSQEAAGAPFELELEDAAQTMACDAVAIAAPLEHAGLLLDVAAAPAVKRLPMRQFHTTHVTYVRGRLNPQFFSARGTGAKAEFEALPAVVLTMEREGVIINSVGRLRPISSQRGVDDGMADYKVFSRAHLDDQALGNMFLHRNISATYRRKWAAAYPHFHAPEVFPPFEIAPGLAYVNAIENAASAMETSAIAGRNAALLLHEYFLEQRRPNGGRRAQQGHAGTGTWSDEL